MKIGKKKMGIRESWDNKVFYAVVLVIILALTAMCIIPFMYLLAVSVSDYGSVVRGEVFLIPKGLNLKVYNNIVQRGTLVAAMIRTIVLTVVYVIFCLVMTICCAYPLSVPDLKGKKLIVPFIMFTMYFSGGLIPGYLLIDELGLIDSYWALILPGAISTYNMIVLRTFFASIPPSLKESAWIDGAGDVTVLLKIVLPLSKASLATIALFYAVSKWNSYQDALLYINDPNKAVLQIRLKEMILSADQINELLMEGGQTELPLQTARAGAIIFSLIPVMIIYPFLQRYFIKGTMIGSVKG